MNINGFGDIMKNHAKLAYSSILSKTAKGLALTSGREKCADQILMAILSNLDGQSSIARILERARLPRTQANLQLVGQLLDLSLAAIVPSEVTEHELVLPADPFDLDFTNWKPSVSVAER